MDAFQLDINLLNAIFHAQDISEPAMKELMEWHHNLDPSFSLLKGLLSQYFANDQKALLGTAKRIDLVIISLQERKCPKSFIRALIAVLKINQDKIKDILDFKLLAQKWAVINVDFLQLYFQAFSISIDTAKNSEKQTLIKLPLAQIQERIKSLVMAKDYQQAMNLVKMIEYPENQVKFVLERMANSRQASKAANLIKLHKIDSKLVPQVGQRLNKNTVRHFLKASGWEGTEQIFFQNPEALAYLIQDLVYKNKTNQAFSILVRHPEVKTLLGKQQTIQFLEKHNLMSKNELEALVIPNSLFEDYFGPSQPQKHLSLNEFNIEQSAVKWVESNTPEMLQLLNYLQKAEFMAIDTESIVGKTKLDRKKYQAASIVQLAFKDKIFILDGHKCRDQALKAAIIDYSKSRRPLLGHAIMNDVDTMLCSFGFDETELRLIKFQNIVDTCQLFKGVYPNQKYSNLAHICKIVLKKQVCKQQTLTNWARRPLRKNQLHYAAMDAYCVIKIYEGFIEEVGQNMLRYFLQQNV